MDVMTGATLATVGLTLAGIGWKIAVNTGRTATHLEHMNSQFGKLEKRQEDTEETTESHGARILKSETRLDHHDEKLNHHHTAIEELRKGRRP